MINQDISFEQAKGNYETLYAGLRNGMIGVDDQMRNIAAIMIANGNPLLEGIPSTGKTSAANNLEKLLIPEEGRLAVGRFQGVGDSLPSDIVGSMVIDPETGGFVPYWGPINAHVFLADEFNRNPGKTQNAANEAAQEGKITIRGIDLILPKPFYLFATQNSHELGQATYPTTSAMLDRFMGSVYFGSPEPEHLRQFGNSIPMPKELLLPDELKDREDVVGKLSAMQLLQTMRAVHLIGVEDKAVKRLVELGQRLADDREVGLVSGGTEAGMGYRYVNAGVSLAKAFALIEGKQTATVEQINAAAPLVFPHRITSIKRDEMVSFPTKLDRVNELVQAA